MRVEATSTFCEDGSIFDADTKVLVTQARFIFSLSVAAEHLKDPKYLKAVEHGVTYLARGPLRNTENGAYHWALKDGRPTSSKIFTYGLAQCLLAYARRYAAAPYLNEGRRWKNDYSWKRTAPEDLNETGRAATCT